MFHIATLSQQTTKKEQKRKKEENVIGEVNLNRIYHQAGLEVK